MAVTGPFAVIKNPESNQTGRFLAAVEGFHGRELHGLELGAVIGGLVAGKNDDGGKDETENRGNNDAFARQVEMALFEQIPG